MFFVDTSICNGCGKCAKACPANAITIQDKKAVINQSLCSRCGICVDECSFQAITENISTFENQTEQRESALGQRKGFFSQAITAVKKGLMGERRRPTGTGGGWKKRHKGRRFGKGRGRGGRL